MSKWGHATWGTTHLRAFRYVSLSPRVRNSASSVFPSSLCLLLLFLRLPWRVFVSVFVISILSPASPAPPLLPFEAHVSFSYRLYAVLKGKLRTLHPTKLPAFCKKSYSDVHNSRHVIPFLQIPPLKIIRLRKHPCASAMTTPSTPSTIQ